MESSSDQELNRQPRTLASPRHKKSAPRSNLVKNHHQHHSIVEQETEQKKKPTPSIREMISRSSLDNKQVLDHEDVGKKVGKLQTLVMGGGDMGCDGGRINGGGRNGNGWESDYDGRDETDAYYQNMIEANPNNSLLLGNYAKFLKEVRGDYGKAEEYVERAILVNPGYGDALSLYADLIWQTERNADRAEAYFDRAVKSDPNDCYVLASYAKFLWDAEEDDEDNDCQHKTDKSHTYSPDLFQGANGRSHVTAASKI
ncbi:hypothetical protein TSUD_113790 [Trifolium subterraneum]|uniref:Uncharacterized protein n=1 Tax=Trifolium subterraneum TaxID=3900 RepID=A0A2Z6MVR0_TRISU|nr:hypothetical protein TSUD_113790 [Trifolium subterraneum]